MGIGVVIMENKITALTIVYKTKDYMQKAYESFRKFYPDIPLLIGDNSEGDECSEYVDWINLNDPNVEVMFFDKNVGHGEGMHRGLESINSDLVFVFDSDVEFRDGGLLELMERNMPGKYGAGELITLSRVGHNVRDDFQGETIKYLHPYCMMLNREEYFKYKRFTRYGLPPLQAMLEIHDLGHERKLVNIPCKKFVFHASGGTRARYGDVEDIVPGFSGRKGESQ